MIPATTDRIAALERAVRLLLVQHVLRTGTINAADREAARQFYNELEALGAYGELAKAVETCREWLQLMDNGDVANPGLRRRLFRWWRA